MPIIHAAGAFSTARDQPAGIAGSRGAPCFGICSLAAEFTGITILVARGLEERCAAGSGQGYILRVRGQWRAGAKASKASTEYRYDALRKDVDAEGEVPRLR